ncbi:MAG TPA: hypothetical protein VLY63_24875, partial [Anaerolineae bacterium]|nr:hypothetical protein [Anaerolineae bacterium]
MYNQATMDLLVTTKLHIPPTGPSLLPRRRLVARIDEGLRQSGPGGGFARKLTLLSAPAGFGKTTLLSEWAAVSPLVARDGSPADRAAPKTSDSSRITTRVAWLSLDEADNDPVRFLSYLIAALQTVEPDLGRDLLPILQSPGLNPNPDSLPANQSVLQPLSLPLEELLTSLINQVQALAGRGLVLVLDDFHLVTTRIVHRALAFLLEHLPENLHLVIATRAEPSLPLARLRGRGQLTEIRQGDLSFSPEEVAELLNQVMGLSLSNHEVAALTSQTEGWAAGLQMACLALRATLARSDGTAGDFDSFIQAFSGTDRYVLDYLAEEVLRNLPEEIQTFLLRSSILDRFCAPLCDAIVEHAAEGGPHQISRASSQQIIEQLEAENLFVISLDADRAWYRYHRLFADLLRRRLRWRVGAEDRKLLHRRASLWFEQQGSLPEAIDHALEGEDFERAAALVERVAEATLMRSEVTTYLGWVERLPEEVERKRPALCLLHAWALLLGGRSLEAVESQLQEAGEGAALSAGQEMPLRAFVATLQGQIPRAARLSRQALV